ncbi:MAG TPA: aspartyl/asparaginyl beta-hydroxylase domain-containing protein [Planctomycetota bacterium]
MDRHTSSHAFVAQLERHGTDIRDECLALDLERDFCDWPLREAYTGRWRVFPLVFPAAPYLSVDLERNRARCPRTMAVLAGLEGLQGAGFSALWPGTRVHLHRDHYAPGVLRCHLPLLAPRDCTLRMAGHEHGWVEGRCLVFDGQIEHEAVNEADVPRIVLIADFRVSASDRAIEDRPRIPPSA